MDNEVFPGNFPSSSQNSDKPFDPYRKPAEDFYLEVEEGYGAIFAKSMKIMERQRNELKNVQQTRLKNSNIL